MKEFAKARRFRQHARRVRYPKHGLSKRELPQTSGRIFVSRDRSTRPGVLRSQSGSSQTIDSLRNWGRNRAASARSYRGDEERGRRTRETRNISGLRTGTRLRISEINNRAARLSKP